MKRLEKVILVQFYLNDAVELSLSGNAAFLGPNGSGKTSLLDAIQIAMVGAHGSYLAFNSQTAGTGRRTIRDYCLGVYRDGTGDNAPTDRKRDVALTYITLVFKGRESQETVSAGICLEATAQDTNHHVNGMYVLPGIELSLGDHVEQDEQGRLPIKWTDFRQRIGRLSADRGRTPSIQPHAETYVRELIFQLQPKARHINPKEFLKIFRKSIFLRHIEKVDDFVREYLVDEQRIDKKRAMAQIEEFRRLKQLVEQVEQQIVQLSALGTRYKRLQTEHRKAATADALSATYAVEDAGTRIGELQDQLEDNKSQLVKSAPEVESLQQRLQDLKSESEDLLRRETAHPNAGALKLFEKLREQAQAIERGVIRDLLKLVTQYAQLFDQFATIAALKEHRLVFKDVQKKLDRAKGQLQCNEVDGVGESLLSASKLVEHITDAFNRALDAARIEQELKEREFNAAQGAYANIKRGGARVGPDTGFAIDCLNRQGIEAIPICDVITVKDRAWQPAIEALLGRNREALVVAPGSERAAVRVIRNVPAGSRPYGVTIIQPVHLRDEKWVDPQRVLVGSLLESGNKTALAYLRFTLGTTRCVSSEEELEKYPRALTIDGMLSSRGGTRALRLVPADQQLFGGVRNPATALLVKKELDQAGADLGAARTLYKAIKGLENDKLALTAAVAHVNPSVRVTELVTNREKLTRDVPVLNAADQAQIDAWHRRRKEIEERAKELEAKRTDVTKLVATLEERIKRNEADLSVQKQLAQEHSHREATLKQLPDFDAQLLEEIRTAIDADANEVDYAARIRRCLEKRKTAVETAGTMAANTKETFVQYMTEYGIALLEERSDWRKAWTWVQEEHQRLEATELVKYRDETDRARESAEEAFRKDIVIRLHECIQRMRGNISVLNSTLDNCPPFSNGERYQFEARPAASYKGLYDYIMASTSSSGAQFLESDAGPQNEVSKLLELHVSQDASKAPNPLDDYRLLFTFDVLIKQGAQVIGRLSSRTGVASNGEHRTPFYVTAGAALAAAYRIKAGEETSGAALMLLDEAFNGMDPQNALATAEFLSSLGLQLVMAAPDSDYGKLAAVCGSIFEVSRHGPDVFMEDTELKEAARALLMSDLPSKHPELLTRTINRLQ